MLYTSPIQAFELLKEFIPLQNQAAAYKKVVALTLEYKETNGASAAVRRAADPTCLGTCAYLTNKGKHCGRAVPEDQIAHMQYLQCEYEPLKALLKGRALCHTHEETLFGKVKQGEPQDHEDGDEKASKNENGPIMYVGLFTEENGTSLGYNLNNKHSKTIVNFMKVRSELLSKCIAYESTKKNPTTTAEKRAPSDSQEKKETCKAMVQNGSRKCKNHPMPGSEFCKTHNTAEAVPETTPTAVKRAGDTGLLPNVKNVSGPHKTKVEYTAAYNAANKPGGGSSGHDDNTEGGVTRDGKSETKSTSLDSESDRLDLDDDNYEDY